MMSSERSINRRVSKRSPVRGIPRRDGEQAETSGFSLEHDFPIKSMAQRTAVAGICGRCIPSRLDAIHRYEQSLVDASCALICTQYLNVHPCGTVRHQ